jgi:hypothetical protein
MADSSFFRYDFDSLTHNRMTQGTREFFGKTCRDILADDGKFTTEKMIVGQYREA